MAEGSYVHLGQRNPSLKEVRQRYGAEPGAFDPFDALDYLGIIITEKDKVGN